MDGLKNYQPFRFERPGGGPAVSRPRKVPVDPDPPLLTQWGDKALAWGARNGLGEAGDRLLGLSTAAGSSVNLNLWDSMGLEATPPAKLMTYGSILRLGDQPLAWKDLSWENYTKRVKSNCSGLLDALRPEDRRFLFQGVTLQSYLREVVWEGNLKPFKDLMAGGSGLKLGSSLAGMAGLGLLGWGILRNTYHAYQNAKTKKDGTPRSQWRTWWTTGTSFVAQTIKSLVAWEVAGLGFTVGKALLPLGTFPLGGILVGALLASVAYRLLSKAFPEPAPKLKVN
jgi:hypothetical protein